MSAMLTRGVSHGQLRDGNRSGNEYFYLKRIAITRVMLGSAQIGSRPQRKPIAVAFCVNDDSVVKNESPAKLSS